MKKIFVVLLIISAFNAFSQQGNTKAQSPYILGQHYIELDPVIDTNNLEQVIVYEFFGYKCPHCSTFQPYIKPWQKKLPKHIKLVRVPVIFQESWDIFAKAYYTAETMGIIEDTHQALFNAIHKQRKKFRDIEDIADWFFENYKIDKKTFISTTQSFMIDSKIRQAKNMMLKMKIASTPTLVVNGKYKPLPKKLETTSALLSFVNYYANQEAISMGLIK